MSTIQYDVLCCQLMAVRDTLIEIMTRMLDPGQNFDVLMWPSFFGVWIFSYYRPGTLLLFWRLGSYAELAVGRIREIAVGS